MHSFIDFTWLSVLFYSSWPQTAVRAKANDSGYRDGCSFYLCVDRKPSSDLGVDQAGLQCGKEHRPHKQLILVLKPPHHLGSPERNVHTWP